jgi:hypothetical protein
LSFEANERSVTIPIVDVARYDAITRYGGSSSGLAAQHRRSRRWALTQPG